MKKSVRIILLLVSLLGMVISGVQILKYYREEDQSESLNQELIAQAVELVTQPQETVGVSNPETAEKASSMPLNVNFDLLLEQNKDIIAWIYCPGTQISYPVVQSKDNDYYLRRLLDGKRNTAGTIFADYRNAPDFSDFNTLIYGHNMRNDTMFGTLEEYKDQAYYEAHPVWYLLTPDANYKVELAAGYLVSENDEIYYMRQTPEQQRIHLMEAFEKSVFAADVEIGETDKLVSFSTCERGKDDKRFILTGILQQIPE